jgi:cullin 3
VTEHLERLAVEKIVPAFPRGAAQATGGGAGGAEAVELGLEAERFLKAIKGVWDDHTGSMKKLGDILRYMVRSSLDYLLSDS